MLLMHHLITIINSRRRELLIPRKKWYFSRPRYRIFPSNRRKRSGLHIARSSNRWCGWIATAWSARHNSNGVARPRHFQQWYKTTAIVWSLRLQLRMLCSRIIITRIRIRISFRRPLWWITTRPPSMTRRFMTSRGRLIVECNRRYSCSRDR